MTEKTLIIAILVEVILVFFEESFNMKNRIKVLGGGIDVAFGILR